MGNFLEVKDLNFSFQSGLKFQKISFEAQQGEFISFLISNSGGKTTLIKILAGLLKTGASIKLGQTNLNQQTAKEYLSQIGIVFSDFDSQFLAQTIEEELRYPLINLKMPEKQINKRIKEISENFELAEILNFTYQELSEFEKLRVLIAASTIHQPKLLLLDDVFRSLDNVETEYINKLLKKLGVLEDIIIVASSSNLGDLSYSDKIFLIDKGKIVLSESFEDILKKDNILAKAGIVIPPMIDISLKLQFYELIDRVFYDERKLVNKLWK